MLSYFVCLNVFCAYLCWLCMLCYNFQKEGRDGAVNNIATKLMIKALNKPLLMVTLV